MGYYASVLWIVETWMMTDELGGIGVINALGELTYSSVCPF